MSDKDLHSADDAITVGSIIDVGADVLKEAAKAEQEQQKTAQRALELVKSAGTFLGGIFGPPATELGHLFGDQMKFWRFKNAVRILEGAQRIVDERGLNAEQLRTLGFGEGLLLLEASSMEEDESVQEMWARLMANAVDPANVVRLEKVYIDILKSLSVREVVFLNLLSEIEPDRGFRSHREVQEARKRIDELVETAWHRFPLDERRITVQNLVRLRCVAPRSAPIDIQNLFAQLPKEQYASPFGVRWAAVDPSKFQRVLGTLAERQLVASGVTDYKEGNRIEQTFMLTPLGVSLMRACKKTDNLQSASNKA